MQEKNRDCRAVAKKKVLNEEEMQFSIEWENIQNNDEKINSLRKKERGIWRKRTTVHYISYSRRKDSPSFYWNIRIREGILRPQETPLLLFLCL